MRFVSGINLTSESFSFDNKVSSFSERHLLTWCFHQLTNTGEQIFKKFCLGLSAVSIRAMTDLVLFPSDLAAFQDTSQLLPLILSACSLWSVWCHSQCYGNLSADECYQPSPILRRTDDILLVSKFRSIARRCELTFLGSYLPYSAENVSI